MEKWKTEKMVLCDSDCVNLDFDILGNYKNNMVERVCGNSLLKIMQH